METFPPATMKIFTGFTIHYKIKGIFPCRNKQSRQITLTKNNGKRKKKTPELQQEKTAIVTPRRELNENVLSLVLWACTENPSILGRGGSNLSRAIRNVFIKKIHWCYSQISVQRTVLTPQQSVLRMARIRSTKL